MHKWYFPLKEKNYPSRLDYSSEGTCSDYKRKIFATWDSTKEYKLIATLDDNKSTKEHILTQNIV